MKRNLLRCCTKKSLPLWLAGRILGNNVCAEFHETYADDVIGRAKAVKGMQFRGVQVTPSHNYEFSAAQKGCAKVWNTQCLTEYMHLVVFLGGCS